MQASPEPTDEPNPLDYYDLEHYLFTHVRRRFHQERSLSAFDFFSIVIWKSNRAKSTTAKRLQARDPQQRLDLELVVRDITTSLFDAPSAPARLNILMQAWKFRLPLASAILTVLWPDEFTVYDVRACGQLGDFHRLAEETRAERVWDGFVRYRDAVHAAVPGALSLRDQDRVLWARSAAQQLHHDIARGFSLPI